MFAQIWEYLFLIYDLRTDTKEGGNFYLSPSFFVRNKFQMASPEVFLLLSNENPHRPERKQGRERPRLTNRQEKILLDLHIQFTIFTGDRCVVFQKEFFVFIFYSF